MAMILDAFVGKCVERLAVLVEEEVILVLGVKDELKRLQRRLCRIQSVLKDAERRRIQDVAVNNWLNELKDVMYDAEDILDHCRFEGGRLLEDHPSSSSSSSSASPIPPLGELPQLRHISIYRASAVVTIGPEFMGSTSAAAFPKLERLQFDTMDNWEEWSLGGEGIIENRSMMLFPRLQTLLLMNCRNLRSSLPISSFPALKSLEIRNCPALKVVGNQNALQRLTLTNWEMECLPEWLKQLLQQRLQLAEDTASSGNFRFEFYCNGRLLRKCLMDGPEWPIIQRIPQVWIYYQGRLSLDYTKDPFSYKIT